MKKICIVGVYQEQSVSKLDDFKHHMTINMILQENNMLEVLCKT